MLFMKVVTASIKNMIFKEIIKWATHKSLEEKIWFLETGV
jgi:hypothetical protein